MFFKKRETSIFPLVYGLPLFFCENQTAITIIKDKSGPKLKLCPGAPSKFRVQKTQLQKGAFPPLGYSANLCYFSNIDRCKLKGMHHMIKKRFKILDGGNKWLEQLSADIGLSDHLVFGLVLFWRNFLNAVGPHVRDFGSKHKSKDLCPFPLPYPAQSLHHTCSPSPAPTVLPVKSTTDSFTPASLSLFQTFRLPLEKERRREGLIASRVLPLSTDQVQHGQFRESSLMLP